MLSILFATFNGERTLGKMLDGFVGLSGDKSDLEIIAIDNASNDKTAEIIRGYQDELPIRYLHCDRPGKNVALNYGLQFATGSLIVFTDDDIIPTVDWVQQLRLLAEEHPEVDVFGGRIIPTWPHQPPEWILERVDLGAAFAIHIAALAEGDQNPDLIWGPNMMVRSRIFDRGYRFNEAVGPAPGQYVSGSETEFVRRLSAAGYRCFFSNRAVVSHQIRAHQLSRSWLLARAQRFGKFECASLLATELKQTKNVSPIVLSRIRAILVDYLKGLVKGSFVNSDASFRHAWQIHEQIGFLSLLKDSLAARKAKPSNPQR